jgi:hypothetical protein
MDNYAECVEIFEQIFSTLTIYGNRDRVSNSVSASPRCSIFSPAMAQQLDADIAVKIWQKHQYRNVTRDRYERLFIG